MKAPAALLFTMMAFALGAQEVTKTNEATITTKVVDFESPKRGHIRIEKTFRGKEQILSVMISSKARTRGLSIHGKLRYIEGDEDGDGLFESVMLPGESADDFEAFTRGKDGSLPPVGEADYLSLKAKAAEASERLAAALDEAEKNAEPGAAPNGGPTVPKPKSDDQGGGRHR